jgi:ATP-dependent Clp protease ATP-binding subunit ClpX
LISRLLAEAEYNVELCEQGIVFIDEIDKISRKSENPLVRDVSGEGVQQALLKLVEGTKCRVTVGTNKKNVVMDSVEIDTKNILFIAAGAFSELDKIISDRNNQSSKMGFISTIDKQIVDRKQVQQADFVKYGLIQEFTGRFPIITHVDNLTLNDMISVLTEPKHNLIKQMQFYFNIDNIELTFTEQAVRIIAEQALAMKSGARALKSILETILEPYLFDIETIKKDYKAIEITADTILNSSPAIFHKK